MHFVAIVGSLMCFATNVTWTERAGGAIKRQRLVPHTTFKIDLNPSLNHEEKTTCKFLSASQATSRISSKSMQNIMS